MMQKSWKFNCFGLPPGRCINADIRVYHSRERQAACSLLERRFWLQLTDQLLDFGPQSQFVDQAVEVRRFDAEQARSLAQVAPALVDSLPDHLFFSLFGRLSGNSIDVKSGRARGWGQGANLLGQVCRRDEFRAPRRPCVVV